MNKEDDWKKLLFQFFISCACIALGAWALWEVQDWWAPSFVALIEWFERNIPI